MTDPLLPPTPPGGATPQWRVIREPAVHAFIHQLAEMRAQVEHAPEQVHVLQFSRGALEQLRRQTVRDEVARQIPLFGFYRDLVRWLVTGAEGPAPHLQSLRVSVID